MGLVGQVAFSLLVVFAALLYHPPPYALPDNKYLDDPVYGPTYDAEATRVVDTNVSVPAFLAGGRFLRNGPNPVVKAHPYHWFDGDGMLFAVDFGATSVALTHRWLRTPLLKSRNDSRTMSSFLADLQYPWRAVGAVWSMVRSTIAGRALNATTANTALLFHDGRLYALMEAAHPLEVDPVTLNTIGLRPLPGVKGSFTAHPKYDEETRELISFGYIPPGSGLAYYVHGPGGDVFSSRVEFGSVAGSASFMRMPHDFAASKKYSCFYDTPAVRVHPLVMMGLASLAGADPVPPRMVYFPRRSNATRSVPVSGGSVFHFVNAWDDGDDLVVVACLTNRTRFYFNLLEMERDGLLPYLFEWRIDTRRNVLVHEKYLLDQHGSLVSMEFPGVSSAVNMQRPRFIYGAALVPEDEGRSGNRISGVTKYHYGQDRSEVYQFGAGRYGQEPLFVPDPAGGSEDAGALLTFVFDRSSGLSSLLILDAATMTARALVGLGTRVPMGFHTLFLSTAQLQ